MNVTKNYELLPSESAEFLNILKIRFDKFVNRHQGIEWQKVEAKLNASAAKIWSLFQMEITGGEPDVVEFDNETDEYVFCDCAPESPKDRRSVCYDQEALDSRKENKPKTNAVSMASEMGIEILTEDQYRKLQTLENFDAKTSNWLKTPADIRERGGAIFADFRYGKVFVYHNGAESYYAARGFRGMLKV